MHCCNYFPILVWIKQNLLPQPVCILFIFFIYASMLGNYWWDITNRRTFFENFANTHNFDPLVPNNWYTASFGQVLAIKVTKKLTKQILHFPSSQ